MFHKVVSWVRPLLFLIFVNDLPLSVRHSHIFLYADDTKCLKNVSSQSDSHSLQDDLSNLFSWSLQWNLHFNENKCVLLRLCPKHPSVLHDYTINSSTIQVLDCYRDLGILISSDLKWGNHLTLITARAYKVLGLIRRSFSNGLSTSANKRLYSSLVRSQLTYASQIRTSKRLLLWKEYNDVCPSLSSMTFSQPTSTA